MRSRPLLELMVDIGIRGVHERLEAERERLCGPRYACPEERSAYRYGRTTGEPVLGGRRVRLRRPRVRSTQGRELPLPTWEFCRGEDPLNEKTLEPMAVGVATRKYAGSLEAFDAPDTCGDAVKAGKQLLALVRRLEDEHPSAAASLHEGLDETPTAMRLELPAALERTPCSTNAIENLFSRVRAVSHRVKRRRGGSMVLRWAALGLTQAERGFRRVKGAKKGMGKLAAALRENDARPEAAATKLEKQREVA